MDGHANKCSIVSAAAAVVTGRRPQRLLGRWIEGPPDELFHERSKGRTDFVGAGWEVFPEQHEDSCFDPGQLEGQLHEVHAAKAAAAFDWFILPTDPEQIPGMEIPQTNADEFLTDAVRYERRISHLPVGRDDDVPFAAALNGVFQDFVGCRHRQRFSTAKFRASRTIVHVGERAARGTP